MPVIYTFDASATGYGTQTIEVTADAHADATRGARARYSEATGAPIARIDLAIVSTRKPGPTDTIAAVAAELAVGTPAVGAIVKRLFGEAGDDFARAPYTSAPPSLGVVEGPDGPMAEMHLADWAIERIRGELSSLADEAR